MIKSMNKIAAFSILLCTAVIGSVSAQVELGVISGDAKQGKELYYQHGCYGCHGYSGIGKRNLANNVSGLMFSEQVFLLYLRARGELNPSLPTQRMPSFSEQVLSNAQALDIYAYIRTFKDTPPEVEDIPVLKAILDGAKERASQK